jgi:hypothetical protein
MRIPDLNFFSFCTMLLQKLCVSGKLCFGEIVHYIVTKNINMKTFIYTIFVLSTILQLLPCYAQQTITDKIEGIWRGTSLCQVKASACHDENVVYHISKISAALYTIQASKLVNGAEQDMGTFDSVVYDETKQTLRFAMKDKQERSNVWLFRLDGMQMHGTLIINETTLFRKVELKKS